LDNLPEREKVHFGRYEARAHATLLPFPALLGRLIMFPSLHGGHSTQDLSAVTSSRRRRSSSGFQ
jgi:hypothetical protein